MVRMNLQSYYKLDKKSKISNNKLLRNINESHLSSIQLSKEMKTK